MHKKKMAAGSDNYEMKHKKNNRRYTYIAPLRPAELEQTTIGTGGHVT